MAPVSNQDFFDSNLQNIVAASRLEQARKNEKDGDPKASLLALSKSLEEVLAQVESGGATPSTKPTTPSISPSGPTNAQMQQMIGDLMGILGTLEEVLAQWGNTKEQASAQVGQAMMQETQARVKDASDQLQKVASSQGQSDGWATFLKVMEAVVGAAIAVISVLCGQPELAAIVLVMTVLTVSGATDKLTQAISTQLQKDGLPANVANIISSVIVIASTVIVTVASCGAASAAAAQQVATTAAETAETAASEVGEEAASEVADEGASSASRLSRLGNYIKQGGPLKSLPKPVNMGIFAGSQAMLSSNFAQYLATECFSNMPEGKAKDALKALMEVIVNLLAALAGGAAAAGVSAASVTSEFSRSSSLLSLLLKGKTLAYALQAGGQLGESATQFKLASDMNALGETQATITFLQSLIHMNSSQQQADGKAIANLLNGLAQEIASLTADINKTPAAVAQVLQA